MNRVLMLLYQIPANWPLASPQLQSEILSELKSEPNLKLRLLAARLEREIR